MSSSGEVIYLTGCPGVGKTTLAKRLREAVPTLRVLEYGQLLTEQIQERHAAEIRQSDLKEQSAALITPHDVAELDSWLLNEVRRLQEECPVLIDSHPVTFEEFGFRITAFGAEQIQKLNPSRICMLYAAPEAVHERVSLNPDGRPLQSAGDVAMHQSLQSSVAATYGILTRAPVYLFDCTESSESAFARIRNWIA